jgi:hypothetical protein
MSNVLALPLLQMDVITGNNEWWIESIKYVVGDGSAAPDPTTLPQFDLRGIDFEMEVRRRPTDHEVILAASTANRWMAIGSFPDIGYLLLQIPIDEMQTKMAGAYVADVVASDGTWTRKVIEMTLTIVEGITR